MHTITCKNGVYFYGTVSQLRTFLREAARSKMSLAAWIETRLH